MVMDHREEMKEGFFKNLVTHLAHFYLWLYGIKHMVKDHTVVREKTHCYHSMGYSF